MTMKACILTLTKISLRLKLIETEKCKLRTFLTNKVHFINEKHDNHKNSKLSRTKGKLLGR